MHKVSPEENQQRGCKYCAEVQVIKINPKFADRNLLMCPHKYCPYRVLDKYDSYSEYAKEAAAILRTHVKNGWFL